MYENLFVTGSMLIIAVLGAAVFIIAVRKTPVLALVAWLVAACALPYWTGARFGVYWPAVSLVGVMIIAALFTGKLYAPKAIDALPVAIAVISGVSVQMFGANPGIWTVMITHWLVGYFVARAVVPRLTLDKLSSTIAIVITLAALGAIFERFTGQHPFETFGDTSGAGYQAWGKVQMRGGTARIEGAFGHSIAFGGALALAIPFVAISRYSLLTKGAMGLILLVAIDSTQSRGALIAGVLSLALTVLTVRTMKSSHRLVGVVAIVVATYVALSQYADIAARGGSETENSGLYRLDILSLIPTMRAIGPATSTRIGPDGSPQYGAFRSIDNAFMQIGLGYGWIVMFLMVAGLLAVVWRVATGRGNVAEAALVGQIPLLLTAPFLTQWQILVWFMAGTAVSLAIVTKGEKEHPESSPELPAASGQAATMTRS
jgi:hypothetical protein